MKTSVHGPAPFPVLDRLVRPQPPGAIDALIRRYAADAKLLVDPFSRGDAVARVAVRQGRQAILTGDNTLVAFATRAALRPLPARDLHRAFTWLGNALTHQTLLRIHLDELWATTCPRCGQPAIARYFLWRQDTPVAKACICEYCRYETDEIHGLDPVDEADLVTTARIDARRAAERLFRRAVQERSPNEDLVVRLLNLYTPRTLYAIDQLLWTIERGAQTSLAESGLKLIALHALDVCRKLDPVPGGADDPAIDPPAEFRERNFWQAFEEGYDLVRRLAEAHAADPTAPIVADDVDDLLDGATDDDGAPPPNAFAGALSPEQLGEVLPRGSVDALVGELPRPDGGAMRAISGLWAGWLLGADASEPLLDEAHAAFASAAAQWPNYFLDVRDSLTALAPALRDGGRVALLCGSQDPAQPSTVALAAAAAGLEVDEVLFQPADAGALNAAAAYGGSPGTVLLAFNKPADWQPETGGRAVAGLRELTAEIATGGREAVAALLHLRNEPVPWCWLQAAVLEHLGRAGTFRRLIRLLEDNPGHALRHLNSAIRDELEPAVKRDAFVRLEVERERGGGLLWTLPAVSSQHPPLAERIERAVYNVLATAPTIGEGQLDKVVGGLFEGAAAPDPGLVRELLASYSVQPSPGVWSLRIPDQFGARTQEHRRVLGWLTELGHRLDFHVWINRNEHLRGYRQTLLKDLLSPAERSFGVGAWLGNPRAEEVDVVWYGNGKPTLVFEVEWMATITDALLRRRVSGPTVRRFLVAPRDRTALIEQRLDRNTLLRQTYSHDGWTLLDYEELGALGDLGDSAVERVGKLLGLPDPRQIATA